MSSGKSKKSPSKSSRLENGEVMSVLGQKEKANANKDDELDLRPTLRDEVAKRIHNGVERKRKEMITYWIKKINLLLPDKNPKKESKSLILERAYEFLEYQLETNAKLLMGQVSDVEEEEIKRLNKRIAELEDMNYGYTRLLKTAGISPCLIPPDTNIWERRPNKYSNRLSPDDLDDFFKYRAAKNQSASPRKIVPKAGLREAIKEPLSNSQSVSDTPQTSLSSPSHVQVVITSEANSVNAGTHTLQLRPNQTAPQIQLLSNSSFNFDHANNLMPGQVIIQPSMFNQQPQTTTLLLPNGQLVSVLNQPQQQLIYPGNNVILATSSATMHSQPKQNDSPVIVNVTSSLSQNRKSPQKSKKSKVVTTVEEVPSSPEEPKMSRKEEERAKLLRKRNVLNRAFKRGFAEASRRNTANALLRYKALKSLKLAKSMSKSSDILAKATESIFSPGLLIQPDSKGVQSKNHKNQTELAASSSLSRPSADKNNENLEKHAEDLPHQEETSQGDMSSFNFDDVGKDVNMELSETPEHDNEMSLILTSLSEDTNEMAAEAAAQMTTSSSLKNFLALSTTEQITDFLSHEAQEENLNTIPLQSRLNASEREQSSNHEASGSQLISITSSDNECLKDKTHDQNATHTVVHFSSDINHNMTTSNSAADTGQRPAEHVQDRRLSNSSVNSSDANANNNNMPNYNNFLPAMAREEDMHQPQSNQSSDHGTNVYGIEGGHQQEQDQQSECGSAISQQGNYDNNQMNMQAHSNQSSKESHSHSQRNNLHSDNTSLMPFCRNDTSSHHITSSSSEQRMNNSNTNANLHSVVNQQSVNQQTHQLENNHQNIFSTESLITRQPSSQNNANQNNFVPTFNANLFQPTNYPPQHNFAPFAPLASCDGQQPVRNRNRSYLAESLITNDTPGQHAPRIFSNLIPMPREHEMYQHHQASAHRSAEHLAPFSFNQPVESTTQTADNFLQNNYPTNQRTRKAPESQSRQNINKAPRIENQPQTNQSQPPVNLNHEPPAITLPPFSSQQHHNAHPPPQQQQARQSSNSVSQVGSAVRQHNGNRQPPQQVDNQEQQANNIASTYTAEFLSRQSSVQTSSGSQMLQPQNSINVNTPTSSANNNAHHQAHQNFFAPIPPPPVYTSQPHTDRRNRSYFAENLIEPALTISRPPYFLAPFSTREQHGHQVPAIGREEEHASVPTVNQEVLQRQDVPLRQDVPIPANNFSQEQPRKKTSENQTRQNVNKNTRVNNAVQISHQTANPVISFYGNQQHGAASSQNQVHHQAASQQQPSRAASNSNHTNQSSGSTHSSTRQANVQDNNPMFSVYSAESLIRPPGDQQTQIVAFGNSSQYNIPLPPFCEASNSAAHRNNSRSFLHSTESILSGHYQAQQNLHLIPPPLASNRSSRPVSSSSYSAENLIHSNSSSTRRRVMRSQAKRD